MKISQRLMNKPVYLGLSVLHLSKTVMYDSSMYVHLKTYNVHKDITEDGEKRFDTSILKETDHYLQEKIKKELN